MNEDVPEIVELNVGGMVLATRRNILTKYESSMLAAMFSGRHVIPKDRKGRYFIDCDGEIFKVILEYLRFEKIPFYRNIVYIYTYAEYFGIQELMTALEALSEIQRCLRKREYETKLGNDVTNYNALKMGAVRLMGSRYMDSDFFFKITVRAASSDLCSDTGSGCQPVVYAPLNPEVPIAKTFKETSYHQSLGLDVIVESALSGWSKLLAFDLEELKYGKECFYLKTEERRVCKRCNRHVGMTEYVLVRNKSAYPVHQLWMKP